ncbi:hypothetical protein NMY22_g16013 [Coprinellus aureogranulatus]|nr:hypothetical protein NMY22_g16013 [Coprinellus aureogranulatus]
MECSGTPSEAYQRGVHSPLYPSRYRLNGFWELEDDSRCTSATTEPTSTKDCCGFDDSGTEAQPAPVVHRRWESRDLVEQTFGTTIPIPLAAHILLTLLRHKFLHVEHKQKLEGQTPAFPLHELWVEACVESAADVYSRLFGTSARSNYVWTWPGITANGNVEEANAPQVFDVPGALGYAIARKLDPEFAEKYSYRNRFALLFKKGIFGDGEGQDYQPDLIGLPVDAFVSAETTSEDTWRYLDVPTPNTVLGRLDAYSQAQTVSGEEPPGASITLQRDLRRDLKEMLATDSDLSTYQLPPASLSPKVDSSRINWAGLVATGEVRRKDPNDSMLQEFIYMERQRLAQPYLRYVPGFTCTRFECAFLRSDAMGTEECRLKKSHGWGVMDKLEEEVHAEESFVRNYETERQPNYERELSEVSICIQGGDFPQANATLQSGSLLRSSTTDSAEGGSPVSGSACNKRKANSKLQPQGKRAKALRELRARKAIFVTIPDAANPAKKTRFYLDYIAVNRGGLAGRATRVWCVYQEILEVQAARDAIRHEDLQEALEALETKGRVFVGPYALKLQNVDMQSAYYKDDVQAIIKAKAEEDPEGSRFVLIPQSIWKGAKILDAIRGLKSKEDVPARVVEHVYERQEVFSLSLYKRTPKHYKSFAEVGNAVSDVFQAILWLDKHRIVHRDISIGNVLLNQEEPTSFVAPRIVEADDESILLCRRQPSQLAGVYGLLHDLDMAYIRPDVVVAVSGIIASLQTGFSSRRKQKSLAHRSPPDLLAELMEWADAYRAEKRENQVIEAGATRKRSMSRTVGLPHTFENDVRWADEQALGNTPIYGY